MVNFIKKYILAFIPLILSILFFNGIDVGGIGSKKLITEKDFNEKGYIYLIFSIIIFIMIYLYEKNKKSE